MTKQEQIEEMVKIFQDANEISQLETIIDRHFRSDNYKTRNILDLVNEVAKDIINAGYKQEKEVVKDILQDLLNYCALYGCVRQSDILAKAEKYGIELE